MADNNTSSNNVFGYRWMLQNEGSTLGEYRSYVNKLGNKRYYSSTDAKLFFGDEELDEIVSIQWQMQEPKMPLYGYNSFTFDDVAVGSRIIQGTFIINYLIPNYLAKLVKTNAKTVEKNDTEKKANDQSTVGKETTNTAVAHDKPSDSIYSSDSGDSGKIDHHKAHTNLPQNFSIKIRYGSDKEGKVPYITFDEVWIEGMAHTITENGSPIYEQYSFIARDVGYSAWSR